MTDRFAGTAPSPVDAGEKLKIAFSDAAKPNSKVTIEVSNGMGASTKVEILLDAAGNGTVEWPVPPTGWDLVRLSHPSSEDHTVAVTHAEARAASEEQQANADTNAAGDAFLEAQRAIRSLLHLRTQTGRVSANAAVYLSTLARLTSGRPS